MTTIHTEVRIAAAPEAVYDYITRPARWKEWHPASLGAGANAQASLAIGDEFEEDIRAAGFTRHLHWHVEASERPARWAARARMADGSMVHLLYELSGDGGGTRLKRTLSYAIHPRWLRWLNNLLLWRRVRAESLRAMERLRRHWQQGAA